MKNNNKILYISIAILVLAVGIAFGTYAYYQTTISGTISGNVAKWSFKANGQTSNLSLNLGSLYPGVSNTYNLELSAEDSELDVYYEVVIGAHQYPINNHLYWDSANDISVLACDGTPGIYGTISAGSKVTVPLYFNWPYDSYSPEGDSGKTKTADIIIVGQQLTGYSDTIPMELLSNELKNSMSANTVTYSAGYINTTCIPPM